MAGVEERTLEEKTHNGDKAVEIHHVERSERAGRQTNTPLLWLCQRPALTSHQ
jgi:hypothetical protein